MSDKYEKGIFSMKKRLILLCVLVLAVALAMGIVEANAASVIDSGTCGSNLTWKLTDDGTLTISGTGSMYSYSFSNQPFWEENYDDDIKRVIIEPGATSLGAYAFYSLSKVESVEIPDTVTKIGNNCFSLCDSLRSIEIPNSVNYIGDYCFSSSVGLQYVIIPYGVKIINRGTFQKCSGLEYIQIPTSVTEIGYSAFYKCDFLTDVYYGGTYSQYSSIDINDLSNENSCLHNATKHYSTCFSCCFGNYSKTDEDYHSRFCLNCGKEEKFAHNYDNGVITLQPNCKYEGIKTYTCDVCKATKEESVPRNNTHSYGEWGYENDSTHRKVCSICATSYNEKHTWTTGNVESKCSICNSTRWLTRAAKPIITHYTNNSVTLLAVDGYEYSLDFKNWQDSNEFTGLSPNGL